LPKLSRRQTKIALIPTIIYGIVALLLNILKVMDGPYPFLKVYQQPFFISIPWALIMIGGAYLIALGLHSLSNKLS